MFKLETAKHMFKLKNDILPTTIGNYFQLAIDNSETLNLRRRERPTQVITRLVSSDRKSIQIRGEKFWEQIPEIIRSKNSLNAFKRYYKKSLLEE